ncbi:MAG TPA: hypothetical protein VFR24_19560 [Candidatus Angelobacter sp.]|nr:hypothetical protein [Candidatus Angelobacter sp.]
MASAARIAEGLVIDLNKLESNLPENQPPRHYQSNREQANSISNNPRLPNFFLFLHK